MLSGIKVAAWGVGAIVLLLGIMAFGFYYYNNKVDTLTQDLSSVRAEKESLAQQFEGFQDELRESLESLEVLRSEVSAIRARSRNLEARLNDQIVGETNQTDPVILQDQINLITRDIFNDFERISRVSGAPSDE